MDRNKAYKAFDINEVGDHNEVFLVPKNKTITLYDGRYCAVAGFIYAIVDGKYCVLANKRGIGTPDFQGYWNCPCGYLERGENSRQGISRETNEECNILVSPDKFTVTFVQTEPSESNNGNVTIHHTAFIGRGCNNNTIEYPTEFDNGGEENEVQDIRWIPVTEINRYKWAFGHDRLILKYAAPIWKRVFLKVWFKFFGGYDN